LLGWRELTIDVYLMYTLHPLFIIVIFQIKIVMYNFHWIFRFTIEVADFDFGQANDLEYKTFRERLRDAFTDAFPGSADLLDSRSDSQNRANRPIWTERTTSKYGNVENEWI
jgi:hypothetical protein